MNAGEQLSALEMMGVDPIRRILGPRFLACVISMPLLAIMFSAVGIIGSWVVAVPLIGLDSGAFWAQMQAGVEVGPDIGNGIIKTFVFGVAVGAIALTKAIQLVQRRKVFRARLREQLLFHLLLF